ncbi:MAG TPA: hypothetical protein PLB91_01160 [Spirochaetales bacterium]|nr:hypothetical protein [Spirochaetales bacterium]
MSIAVVSPRLGDLISRYRARFAGDPADGFSLNETTLDENALIARLERALAEGKAYDPYVEEWSPEQRKMIKSGAILI